MRDVNAGTRLTVLCSSISCLTEIRRSITLTVGNGVEWEEPAMGRLIPRGQVIGGADVLVICMIGSQA